VKWKTSISLIGALCLVATLTACQHGTRDDSPSGSTQAAEPNWTVAWSQIKLGMDPVQVLSLVGEPRDVKVTKISTAWYYSDRRAEGPHVVFSTREMRVERWRAPEQR
jgi:hypothetical protein